MIRQHYFSFRDDKRFCVAQFLRESLFLRDLAIMETDARMWCLGMKLNVL